MAVGGARNAGVVTPALHVSPCRNHVFLDSVHVLRVADPRRMSWHTPEVGGREGGEPVVRDVTLWAAGGLPQCVGTAPTARSSHSATAVNATTMVVMGGISRLTEHNDVYVFELHYDGESRCRVLHWRGSRAAELRLCVCVCVCVCVYGSVCVWLCGCVVVAVVVVVAVCATQARRTMGSGLHQRSAVTLHQLGTATWLYTTTTPSSSMEGKTAWTTRGKSLCSIACSSS